MYTIVYELTLFLCLSLSPTPALMMNELEMAVWALYLKKLGWFDPSMQVREGSSYFILPTLY